MAITDNNFTPEEFTAAITANPDLVTHVRGALGASKYVVRNETEETDFRTAYEKQVADRVTSNNAANIEKDIFESTGIAKAGPEEKYHDYMKRAFGTYKTNTQKLEKELTDLRSGNNPEDAKRIKQLEKALEDRDAEHTKTLETVKKEVSTERAKGAVLSDVADLRKGYSKLIKPSIIKMAENVAINEVMHMTSFKDGQLVLLDDKGEIMYDQTTMKPVKPATVLAEKLKDLMDETVTQTGTGIQPGKPAAQPSGNGAPPATVKTRVQLTEYMRTAGMVAGKEYNEYWTKHSKDLPLR